MKQKNKLDRNYIIEAAAKLCEETGLEGITLFKLAETLGIKTPSLYNHIDGLEDLYLALATNSMKKLGERIGDAAVGKADEEAVRAMAYEYRKFAEERPEEYKAIIKSPALGKEEVMEANSKMVRVMYRVLEVSGFSEEDTVHAIRGLRSLVHGFVSLEEAGFFKGKYDIEESFKRMVENYIRSIYCKGK